MRLMAVGDVMLARTLRRMMVELGPTAPFEHVLDTFAQADLVVANLECVISSLGERQPKAYTFHTRPEAADALAAAGIDVVSVANNHVYDFGPDALLDSLARLDAAGIGRAGAGADRAEARAPLLVESNGVRIAFLGYAGPFGERSGWHTTDAEAGPHSPGMAIARPRAVERDVTAARALADVVIVMVHAGTEYASSPNPSQRAIVDAAMGAGATMYLGHHPHVLQGAVPEPPTLIAYSLGNFVFDLFDGPSRDSVIADVTLTAEGVTEVRWIPVLVSKRDGRPRLAGAAASQRILARLHLSD